MITVFIFHFTLFHFIGTGALLGLERICCHSSYVKAASSPVPTDGFSPAYHDQQQPLNFPDKLSLTQLPHLQ
ncbi:hypothetical protein [Bacillus sp. ISL-57]|uniref:hypothetical protein n=1 Tax=Bacillus sp. ISL-57 TaxID=2819135 RepID=UPI001BECAB22|nr:hypothetical protein [Bacillus sp. ISL-57]